MLELRIKTAAQAMKLAQESANHAEKSSAGDKYETSRAMGQIERDMNAKQLEEVMREMATLLTIDSTNLYDTVTKGSFVICKKNFFFIATGLGTVTHDDKTIIILSPKAPLSLAMNQKKAGDSFIFNGNEIEIVEVF